MSNRSLDVNFNVFEEHEVREELKRAQKYINELNAELDKSHTTVYKTSVSYKIVGAEDIHKVILADTTSNNITITLPPATGNRSYLIIKKIAAENSLIIEGEGSETIDDGANATITVLDVSLSLISDGNNWRIV